MKKITTIILCLSFINLYSQVKNYTCRHKHQQGKLSNRSNLLNKEEITETKKYDVYHYAFDIQMNNLSTNIKGNVELHANAIENIDSVIFELSSSLTINYILVNNVNANFKRYNSAVKVNANLTSGDSFIITVNYEGTPENVGQISGMNNASSGSWGNQVTWSLSEPFNAYQWFPCKQDLTDKIDSVSMKITVPSTTMAGSNGVLENTIDLENGFTRYEWLHKYPIDYYLISVAIAEYVEYNVFANPEGSTSPVLIQNFIYNNPQTLTTFKNDIDETVDFMEYFATIYGPYPFQDEKYGHCMTPFSGGMEHQTMTSQGFFERTLTAHELAHQWWGNHVTCASWADIWVNEGFTSYSEYLMLENLYPGDEENHMRIVHNQVTSINGGSVYVLDSLNVNSIFNGRLTYDKGAAIVHTMRYIVNDDVLFFETLKNFQNQFSNSTATGLDVKKFFEENTLIDFLDFFNQWYYGEGYPTYSATWNTDGDNAYVNITHTTSTNKTQTFTNPIDITFSRENLSDTTVRLEIASNNDNFIINDIKNINNLTSIDENNWIINRVGNITKDVNLSNNTNKATKNGFKIYPNPSTSGILNYELPENKKYIIEIYDVLGHLVLQSKTTSNNFIDISHLNNGSYLLHLTDNKSERQIRVLIKS